MSPKFVPRQTIVRLHSCSLHSMASPKLPVQVFNPNGRFRVVSTKSMPGTSWIDALVAADCRLEICTASKTILSVDDILQLIGDRCDGVIGQLTEEWGERLFAALARAGGRAYSNMAVGYNNVDVDAATRHGIAVGNTPFGAAACRLRVITQLRTVPSSSLFLTFILSLLTGAHGALPRSYPPSQPPLSPYPPPSLPPPTHPPLSPLSLPCHPHLPPSALPPCPPPPAPHRSAYARMMVEGFKMNLIYYDLYQSKRLEESVSAYSRFLQSQGEPPVTWRRASSPEEVLQVADVVSLHPVLDKTTFHLLDERRLNMMKKDAILVNCSRGPVVDEVALVRHLKANPAFRAALDVFEDEPRMKPGLSTLPNVVAVPHIASASQWTRAGMAALAALNVASQLQGYPVWHNPNDVLPFLDPTYPPPKACPSIVNAKQLGLPTTTPSKL
ncbi:unnamed protein product [Closterium sp. Yama58-4]|nr:unnamed protein product [Closterium sp. Yama58-4]